MAESNDNVNEQPEQPEEIASEDVVGGQETPSADALDREQAIVDEPVAESEQHRGRGDLDRDAAASTRRSSSTSRRTRRRA